MSGRVLKQGTAIALLGLLAGSCGEDDNEGTTYPSVITELADMPSNGAGVIDKILTDGGECFYLTNPRSGYRPEAVYRGLCGYVKEMPEGNRQRARLASLRTVFFLRDSTDVPQRTEPTTVVSVWRGGEYINVMLSPQTRGGTQYWGYRRDSLRVRNGVRHLYLSLHHGQNDDPPAYSETRYASLWLQPLAEVSPGDSLWFTAFTPNGRKTWRLLY